MNDAKIYQMINRLSNATALLTMLYLDPSADPAQIENLEQAKQDATLDIVSTLKRACNGGF